MGDCGPFSGVAKKQCAMTFPSKMESTPAQENNTTNPGIGKNTSRQTTMEKIKGKIMDFLKLIPGVLSELPLLATTLVFKLGTINLCILFFGWWAIFVLLTFFLLNVLSCYLVRLDRVSKLFAGYRIVLQDLEEEETEKKPGLKHILYTSYANMFMFTRSAVG